MALRTRFIRGDSAAEYLAIDWENSRLRGVALRAAGGQHTLLGSFKLEWSDAVESGSPEAAAGQLKEAVRALPLKSPRALIVLPRDVVVIRRLDLPPVPENELPNLVRLQAATKLSTPVDRLALDFVPLPTVDERPGQSVLLASIEQERLDRMTGILKAAGLEPLGCTTSTTAVAELARRCTSAAGAGLTLVAYQHGQRLELSAIHDQQLILSHSTTLPAPDDAGHTQPFAAELTRVLVAVRQIQHDATVGRVLLVQEGQPDEQVMSVLKQRFGEQISVLTSDDLHRGAQLSGPLPADVSAAALGAAVAEEMRVLPRLDFLRPRRTVVGADPRRQRIVRIAVAAGLLFLAGGSMYYSALAGRDDQIAGLERQKSALSGQLNNPDAKDVLAAAEAINAWAQGAAHPLNVLTDFQALLPGTDRLYLSTLRFTPQSKDAIARLHGEGYARERRDVVELYQRMVDAGHRVRPQTIVLDGKRDPDYPFSFTLDVELLPPRSSDAAESAGKPQTAGAGGTGPSRRP